MGSTLIRGEEILELTMPTVELLQEVGQGTSYLEEILNFDKHGKLQK